MSRHFYLSNQSLKSSLPTGPATQLPPPPPSIRIVKDICGFSTGANTVNQAWVLSFSSPNSAVPVLQAVVTSTRFLADAVDWGASKKLIPSILILSFSTVKLNKGQPVPPV